MGSSRLDGGGHSVTSTPGGAAASAVHRALASNPEATSRLVSAGLKQGVPKNSPYGAAASTKSLGVIYRLHADDFQRQAHNEEISNSVGRLAAASLAFSAGNAGNSSRMPPPSAPPRRGAATSPPSPPSDTWSPPVADKTESQTKNLISNRVSSHSYAPLELNEP